MAELDYAFLADYAQISQQGTLTAINASFTYLQASELPMMHRLAVAGRVRGHMDEPPIPLKMTFSGPEGTPEVTGEAVLVPGPDSKPYGEGMIGHLFVMDVSLALVQPGMYWATIELDGVEVRKLGYEVHVGPRPA